MNKNDIIIAFDFDGVLCDSIHDSIRTALNSYFQCVKRHTLPVRKPLEASDIFPFEAAHQDFIKQFRDLMPLGNFAQDYYVILNIIQDGKTDDMKSQENFNNYKSDLDQNMLANYDKTFYKLRHTWQKKDPEGWVKMLPPFKKIPEAVRSLSKKHTCAIATSKDIQSVTLLLDAWDLSDCFEKKNILDKDFAPSKRDHLIHFHKKTGTPYQNIYFIDDKLSHLDKVADLGVNPCLSIWGFNTSREHTLAREKGYILLKLEDVPEIGSVPPAFLSGE